MSAEDGAGEPPAGADARNVGPAPGPRAGKPRIGAGIEAGGGSAREIAVALYGAGRVDAEWHADGPMRARVRRLLRRAGAAAKHGPQTG